MKITTVAAVFAGLEILAALYLSWITFLFAFWFVDDGIAFTMTDADWQRVGVERFLQGAAVGVVFGALVWLANRLLGFVRQPGLPKCLPWVLASFVVVACGLGALWFVIDWPYI